MSDVSGQSRRPRVLLLGGCHVESLGRELAADFDCVQLWRRPTIPLMSPPPPRIGRLDFDNRHARYVMRDCAKAHLPELKAAEGDVLVIEIVRDVRCPLLRSGGAYLFDPNRMYHLVPDAPPVAESRVDLDALLCRAPSTPLDPLDPDFFGIWSEHFDRFHTAVLAPWLARGRSVVVLEVYLAKQTLPPSDLFQAQWPYCDLANALLRRMYAHLGSYPSLIRVGFEEAQCVTASGMPGGSIAITHLLPELFALAADQIRAALLPGHESAARSTFARLMARADAGYGRIAALETERHVQNLEILRLREQLDVQEARHAWELRRMEARRLRNRVGRLLSPLSATLGRIWPGRRGSPPHASM